jgi:hypothetical protein
VLEVGAGRGKAPPDDCSRSHHAHTHPGRGPPVPRCAVR